MRNMKINKEINLKIFLCIVIRKRISIVKENLVHTQ